MIVEWFLDLVQGVVEWFLGLFDSLEVPEWLTTPPPEIYTFFGNMQSMGVWVPWTLMGGVLAAVLSVYVIGFIAKLVKQILAHVPAFGGAG